MRGERRGTGWFAARIAAELIVIIAGVMIALWADSRVSARAERRTERVRLTALASNVDTTLVELGLFSERVALAEQSLRYLFDLGPGGSLPATDSVRGALLFGFMDVPPFDPQLDVYDDLRSSGELGLLQDPLVRRHLSAMQAARESLAEAIEDLMAVQQLNFDPYLLENADLAAMWPGIANASAGNTAGRLVRDREFRNMVVFKMDLIGILTRSAARMNESLVQLQAAVRDRIERLS